MAKKFAAKLADARAGCRADRTLQHDTDPGDFAPYTEAELDAYTATMERLTADFDIFTAAFTALDSATLNPDDDFYITAHACFNVYCETYKIAVGTYKMASILAIATAAAAKAQALKDGAKAWIKAIALNPDAEVKTTEGEIKADLFQEKARVAETKAEAFLAKVNFAEDKAPKN